MPDRREFVVALAGQAWLAFRAEAGSIRRQQQDAARLSARARVPTATIRPGTHPLNLGVERDGVLHVPPTYRPDLPMPLLLALHGAGGRGQYQLNGWRPLADERGFLVLAPDSRGPTWDIAYGGFGRDVRFINDALADVFRRCHVNAERTVISGFSDGASYALSLGLANGDLFKRVVAFSPGFMVPAEWHGTPRIFMSHGTADRILPIDATSRRLRPMLERAGYRVTFREFEGGHDVPAAIRADATTWMLG